MQTQQENLHDGAYMLWYLTLQEFTWPVSNTKLLISYPDYSSLE